MAQATVLDQHGTDQIKLHLKSVLLERLGVFVALIGLFLPIYLLWVARYIVPIIPLSLGLYSFLRDRTGERVDELVAICLIAPMIPIVVGGLVITLFVRVFVWLASATWLPITVQTVWGWPSSATGLLGLDKIIRWLVVEAPLELWIVVIFPALWFGAYNLPAATWRVIKRTGSTPNV
jgi:hypothetical protein